MATAKTPAPLKINIIQDPSNSDSPRSWDNLGTMVCNNSRYNLGDENSLIEAVYIIEGHFSEQQLESLDFDRECIKSVEKTLILSGKAIVLPLYLYDHSGITIRTTSFSCPWDSGKVGFIFVSLDDLRAEFSWKRINQNRREKTEQSLRSEVEVYDQYITGDVWGYEVIEDGEIKDSCWGFYGSDTALNGIIDHLCADAQALVKSGQYERVYL